MATEVDNEKTPGGAVSANPSVENVAAVTTLPPGWKYKTAHIGKHTLPWYASPFSQLVIVAFVCFLCPGMFNALSGMGGGGQVNAHAADNANVALYSTFAVVGKLIHRLSCFTRYQRCSSKQTRFLRRHCCQHSWCQDCSVLWWFGILHLRSIVSLLQPHSEQWVCYLCRCSFGRLRWMSVVGPGRHHDVLPRRAVQGKIHFFVLDHFQLGLRHWQLGESPDSCTLQGPKDRIH